MEVCPHGYFWWFGYFWGSWVSFVTADEFLMRVIKIISQIVVAWTHSLTFYFFLLVCFLCLKDNSFDKSKVFLIHFESSHSISTPLCCGTTFNPKFWKVGYQKKMSTWRDLKSSCHGYLPGRLTIYLVKKRLKNKIWFWGLNFKCWFWPVLTKQPINV